MTDMITNEMSLEKRLSQPSDATKEALSRLTGDFLVLGAGGKMGPTMTRKLKRALPNATVTAVSRFSDPAVKKKILSWDVKTVECDLLEPDQIDKLPDAENVIFMAGMKFGTSGQPSMTWAQNTYAPALVCRRFSASRIMAFSTGNVYPFWPDESEGPAETDPTGPVGEYAQSCIGRERIFQFFSERNGTPTVIVRLNYACEMRYGILVEIGRAVLNGNPVDLSMGFVNVIWQGTATDMAFQSLGLAASPASVVNVAGPKMAVKAIAERFGELFDRQPVFSGSPSGSSLLNNGAMGREKIGAGSVDTDLLIQWTARWLAEGKPVWSKPTHFQEREGTF